MAGVLVANTTLDEVAQSLRNVVTVTITALGANVQFPFRPRNCRPRIVEVQEETTTCEVRAFENPPLTQQESQVQSVLLAVHLGTVTLALVQEEDGEAFVSQ